MPTKKKEINPFENKKVAQEWVNSVENEKDLFRDKAIYPLLSKWFLKTKAKKVVEIGSGQGICSEKINLKGKEYAGIEPSKFLVQRARTVYKKKNTKFVVGNAYKLPLKNEIADAVFSVMVWFHLKDVETASKELSRILKRKGKFLIISANPEKYDAWEKSFIKYKRYKDRIVGIVNVPINPISHSIIYTHSAKNLFAGLESHGLKIESKKQFGDFGKGKQFILIAGYKK